MNEIEINDQIIAEQLKAFKENKPVKEVGIILVHINHGDRREKDNYKLDGEKYFIAYENEPTVPITALKPDLIEFREDYGLDIDTTNGSVSPITHESLNSGRFIELARFKGAIELGVDYYEMYNLEKDGTWGTYTVFDRKGNEVQKERIPKKLKADVKKDIKINIAKGLYVLCMFVGEETEKPDQIAKVQAQQVTNQVVEQVSTYSKIAGIGKEVGIAVKEGLLAVVDVADKFGGTNVGKFTMTMIAWKIIGKDIFRIVIGLVFLVIYIIFISRYYKDNFTVHKVAVNDNGWRFWLPKEWKLVEPKQYEGYEFVKWLTILMVVGGFGVTYAIMFG
jgi:hypothetical protein